MYGTGLGFLHLGNLSLDNSRVLAQGIGEVSQKEPDSSNAGTGRIPHTNGCQETLRPDHLTLKSIVDLGNAQRNMKRIEERVMNEKSVVSIAHDEVEKRKRHPKTPTDMANLFLAARTSAAEA